MERLLGRIVFGREDQILMLWNAWCFFGCRYFLTKRLTLLIGTATNTGRFQSDGQSRQLLLEQMSVDVETDSDLALGEFLCTENFVHSEAAVYDRRCLEKAPLTEHRYNHHPGGQAMRRPPRM